MFSTHHVGKDTGWNGQWQHEWWVKDTQGNRQDDGEGDEAVWPETWWQDLLDHHSARHWCLIHIQRGGLVAPTRYNTTAPSQSLSQYCGHEHVNLTKLRTHLSSLFVSIL